jgi:adenine-specific DNA-methyltransferase
MWETVAVWDKQLLDRKTGLRPYKDQRSLYCFKDKCVKAFDDLIQNASCSHILFSYNTEGIIPNEQITRILSKKGKLTQYEKDYRRFKSNSKGKKPRESLKELLYLVEVS